VAATGGSAGAFLALMLGVSDDGDYKDELTTVDDPTLESTNLSQSSAVQVIIDHWGGVGMLEQLTLLDGISRWDATDAPVQIVHGTQDESVSFENAQAIKAHYEQTGVPYSYYPLDAGHGAWSAKIEGKTLWESAYDFAVIHLALEVQDEAM
jgi:fermentation-respiration switch protein FrsA (DUF1100 family)